MFKQKEINIHLEIREERCFRSCLRIIRISFTATQVYTHEEFALVHNNKHSRQKIFER